MKTEFGKWLMDKAKEDEYINCCGIRFADSNWWYFVFQVPRQEDGKRVIKAFCNSKILYRLPVNVLGEGDFSRMFLFGIV